MKYYDDKYGTTYRLPNVELVKEHQSEQLQGKVEYLKNEANMLEGSEKRRRLLTTY